MYYKYIIPRQKQWVHRTEKNNNLLSKFNLKSSMLTDSLVENEASIDPLILSKFNLKSSMLTDSLVENEASIDPLIHNNNILSTFCLQ